MYSGLLAPSHLIILLLIIVLLFGAKRLPELGRSLGQGIKEFKEGLNSKEESEENKKPPEAIEGQREARAQEEPPKEKEVTDLKGAESRTRR